MCSRLSVLVRRRRLSTRAYFTPLPVPPSSHPLRRRPRSTTAEGFAREYSNMRRVRKYRVYILYTHIYIHTSTVYMYTYTACTIILPFLSPTECYDDDDDADAAVVPVPSSIASWIRTSAHVFSRSPTPAPTARVLRRSRNPATGRGSAIPVTADRYTSHAVTAERNVFID